MVQIQIHREPQIKLAVVQRNFHLHRHSRYFIKIVGNPLQ